MEVSQFYQTYKKVIETMVVNYLLENKWIIKYNLKLKLLSIKTNFIKEN